MHVGPVHLVNPLWEACGGSEWRTVETWRLVAAHADARLWSEYEPAPAIARHVPIERVSPWRMRFPRGGTLVFVGVYFRIGHWVRFAAPRRVVVIYNTDQPDRLRKNLTRIASCGKTAEVIYTSSALRMRERGFGPVLESLVDVTRFTAADAAPTFHHRATLARRAGKAPRGRSRPVARACRGRSARADHGWDMSRTRARGCSEY
jgi:hypothetical protein